MKLVLISGGSYGAGEELSYNLKEIDEKVVSLTNKAHPRLLFIGFTERSNYYYSFIKKCYMNLGVQCEYLKYDEFDNQKTIESKFKRVDILYLGGGNTLNYLKQIKKYGLDMKIKEFANQDKVIVGLSAGSIICSRSGCSDSRNYKDADKYTCVNGLGLVDLLYVPHFSESKRPSDMPRFMKNKKNKVAVCCDECSALVIENDQYQIIKSNPNAKVYKAFYNISKYTLVEITSAGNVFNLNEKQ